MLHFNQAAQGFQNIVPKAGEVKEQLVEKEIELNLYYDKFSKMLFEYTPRVISAALVLLIGLWLINRIAKIANRAMERRSLEISLRTFLKSLISIGLKIVLIVTVAGMIGIGTTSFVTILGAAGLAVGLALQGSLSNFAGGVLILIFKPFKVGDFIEAGGQSGDVLEIQIFNTILLTVEHKTVILPNGPLSNGTIVNNSRHGDVRIDLELRISDQNNIGNVRQIILDVLKQNEKVILEPNFDIVVGKFSQGALQINVRPFCSPAHAVMLNSELFEQIKLAFEQNGVKLAILYKLER
jgi:small conductance mechanosensitive channel